MNSPSKLKTVEDSAKPVVLTFKLTSDASAALSRILRDSNGELTHVQLKYFIDYCQRVPVRLIIAVHRKSDNADNGNVRETQPADVTRPWYKRIFSAPKPQRAINLPD